MLVAASHRLVKYEDDPVRLRVKSNILGALHIGHSLTVYWADHPKFPPLKYKTISAFFIGWEIHAADRREIPVPFLRSPLGLGNVVHFFAEMFPMWVKARFHNCEDRRIWLNWLVAFVPIGWEDPDYDREYEDWLEEQKCK